LTHQILLENLIKGLRLKINLGVNDFYNIKILHVLYNPSQNKIINILEYKATRFLVMFFKQSLTSKFWGEEGRR
jgi:hypothetical protein